MPESAPAALLAIFLMPGLIGYLVFSSLYCREVEDILAKVCYVALFNVLPLIVCGQFLDTSSIANTDLAKLNIKGAIAYATHFLLTLSLISIVFAVAAAAILNTGFLQRVSIKLRITRKTAHGSILADIICSYPDSYLKFRFKNGGYVIGHPRRYSLHGDEASIFLANAARRPAKTPSNPAQSPEATIDGPGILVLGFDDVLCVEVLEGGI